MEQDPLKKIHQIMGKFLMPLTLEKTYEIIVKEGLRLTGGETGILLLRKGNHFEKVYKHETKESFKQVISRGARKRGFASQTFKSKKIIILDRNEFIKGHPEYKNTPIEFVAYIPLSYGKDSIGVLLFLSTKKTLLKRGELKLLKIFGSMATLAIKKMQNQHEIKEALETRDLFIALASHEFKTPLTSIQIYAELMKKRLSETEGQEKQMLESLLTSINRLKNLINEFLQLDQIKEGEFKYYWTQRSLGTIFEKVVEEFEAIHKDYKISYTNNLKKESDTVIADINKLNQAFNNLLNNAVKFSPKESEISVTLDRIEDNFLIRIQDKGEGIKKKDLDHIFERFYKGSSKKQGMGLGLYLTKEIIDRHQGTISIFSKPKKGTTIEITLPPKIYEW